MSPFAKATGDIFAIINVASVNKKGFRRVTVWTTLEPIFWKMWPDIELTHLMDFQIFINPQPYYFDVTILFLEILYGFFYMNLLVIF